ncbi:MULTISPECIES: hypothetical protein [unclassified Methanosarcina]|uniref:hypothetical protein n=1 Tax=unclassified Methanosarcina TaxID=2644672 RepID=UPI0009E60061|nr:MULTISPECIES: hypothetical protein [unclassified Methanosarcina]
MKLDIIIRSFLIAVLISLIALLLEASYYGLRTATYSITGPFVSSVINSPLNMAVLALIFISSFVMALNTISKRERA